jgi:hypothetical protein
LNPADERFDSWERSVWHWDSIARLGALRQEHGRLCYQVVPEILDARQVRPKLLRNDSSRPNRSSISLRERASDALQR